MKTCDVHKEYMTDLLRIVTSNGWDSGYYEESPSGHVTFFLEEAPKAYKMAWGLEPVPWKTLVKELRKTNHILKFDEASFSFTVMD